MSDLIFLAVVVVVTCDFPFPILVTFSVPFRACPSECRDYLN